jgi:PilZ domain-containing protein
MTSLPLRGARRRGRIRYGFVWRGARLVKQPDPADRAAYPRLLAPSYFSPAGLPLFRRHRQPSDSGLGGISVHTDEELTPGSRLKVEVFLADATTVVCEVSVAWVERLPEGAPARYDVGLMFTTIDPRHRDRLCSALSPR